MNFKLKSMMYRFKVKHIPGKDHVTPDAFSRRQDSPISQISTPKQDLDGNFSNVMPGYSDTMGPPSWVSTPSVAAMSLGPSPTEAKAAFDTEELLANGSCTGFNSWH